MSNVSTIVKTIQDIMRKDAGVDGDAQRLAQLGWMFFLKIFDDREQELEVTRDSYKSPLPRHLRWSQWATDDEGITGEALLDFINNTLLPKLKNLPGGDDKITVLIRAAFDGANNYMKNGTLMRQVINKINGIDFNASDDRHMFGDIYEKLLKDLQSAGNAGEFYTPRAVTQFIVEQVNPQLSESVLDPACGTGGFLACTIEHLRKQAKTAADERKIQNSFSGIEKKHLPHILCITNMLLHGIDVPSNVRHDNTLGRPLRDWGPKERVDVIVTNPPFGGIRPDMRGPLRFVFALTGASAGAALMALGEGRALLGDTDAPPPRELLMDLMGVYAPIAFLAALVTFALAMFFEPARTKAPTEYAADLRALPVLLRSRLAALLPLLSLAAVCALVVSAHIGRDLLSEGAPRAAGAALALSTLGVFAGFAVLAVSLSSPLRKLLAHAGGKAPLLIDPVFTFSLGTFVAALLFALGVGLGDASGMGPTPLAILGVLARKELDLSPVTHVLGVFAFAYLGLVIDGRVRKWSMLLLLPLLAACVALPLLAARAAHALNQHENVTREVERRAPAGRIGLRILRKLTDRDKDGRSALFGGLDCDDRDPRRSPDFFDKPGNDIDEDCSGADTPAPVKKLVPVVVPEAPAKHYNVILITVDTLRADVGFLGYPQPVSPNLDRLAEKSTVYEHAYAMASYTGKSIGPMLIGKYPSETSRDGSHFNAYDKNNVFVTKRLQDAGIHTFGCSGHWYWKPWSGVTQGMDLFDLSPIPPGMTDNDNSVGGDRVSDAAIRMLKDDAHTAKPFFMWIHYFDPHAQYVPHPGAPTFLSEKPGPAEYTRAAYDGEVWFTDQQVGRVIDYVQNAPFAKDTAIIVTADHGEALGEHNMSWHGAELWEMLVHVPLLVYVPDAPPRRIAEQRSHIDLVPTILDLEAVKKPTDGSIDGVSLLSDVRLPRDVEPKERDVYMDMPAGPWNLHRRALITGKSPGMKLIHLGGPSYQLFDLAADPGEKNDLSSDKERVKELADRMMELRSHLTEIDVKPDTP